MQICLLSALLDRSCFDYSQSDDEHDRDCLVHESMTVFTVYDATLLSLAWIYASCWSLITIGTTSDFEVRIA